MSNLYFKCLDAVLHIHRSAENGEKKYRGGFTDTLQVTPDKMDLIHTKGIVYGALNNLSKKWYIGSTTNSIDYRRHEHYLDALKGTKTTRKFMFALAEYNEADWTWKVHAEFQNISKRQLHLHEAEYQVAFNSIENGYNMVPAAVSLGGSHADRVMKDESDEAKAAKAKWNAYCRAGNQKRKAADPEGYKAAQHSAYLKMRQDPAKVEKMRANNRRNYALKKSTAAIT